MVRLHVVFKDRREGWSMAFPESQVMWFRKGWIRGLRGRGAILNVEIVTKDDVHYWEIVDCGK